LFPVPGPRGVRFPPFSPWRGPPFPISLGAPLAGVGGPLENYVFGWAATSRVLPANPWRGGAPNQQKPLAFLAGPWGWKPPSWPRFGIRARPPFLSRSTTGGPPRLFPTRCLGYAPRARLGPGGNKSEGFFRFFVFFFKIIPAPPKIRGLPCFSRTLVTRTGKKRENRRSRKSSLIPHVWSRERPSSAGAPPSFSWESTRKKFEARRPYASPPPNGGTTFTPNHRKCPPTNNLGMGRTNRHPSRYPWADLPEFFFGAFPPPFFTRTKILFSGWALLVPRLLFRFQGCPPIFPPPPIPEEWDWAPSDNAPTHRLGFREHVGLGSPL